MWENKHTAAYRGAKPTDHLRYRPARARDSGAEGEETEPGRHANCDGTIIRLLRVRLLSYDMDASGWSPRQKCSSIELRGRTNRLVIIMTIGDTFIFVIIVSS